MGTTFQHISDIALAPSSLGECQHCEESAKTSYDYTGDIVDPSLAANPQLAADEPEIYAACADCINSGNLRKHKYELAEIQRVVDQFIDDKESAIEQYHRIPHIPLMMQRNDWPACCGTWCEFTGNPSSQDDSVSVPSNHQYWNSGPTDPHWNFELRPESLREVCKFNCVNCGKRYFIWQPT